uniref:hypothetical protein n=1 Tax=Actinoplanes sp. RD1 TaxID=3064538 RepID=UPI0027418FD3
MTERLETGLLALILAVVAGAAGWVSFTHMHDWTMRHMPAGTPDAFGWVNAVISELVPVASLLSIRRRRRAGKSIGYPLALLLACGVLSLAAQIAVASPSASGWLLSAVPALAFMALVKLVFAESEAVTSEASALPAETVPPVPSTPVKRPTAVAPIRSDAFSRLNGISPEA